MKVSVRLLAGFVSMVFLSACGGSSSTIQVPLRMSSIDGDEVKIVTVYGDTYAIGIGTSKNPGFAVGVNPSVEGTMVEFVASSKMLDSNSLLMFNPFRYAWHISKIIVRDEAQKNQWETALEARRNYYIEYYRNLYKPRDVPLTPQ